MVLLIGNYPPDQQQSMDRFAAMMLDGLQAAGVPAAVVRPTPLFGRFAPANTAVGKWLGYIDKFVLFPFALRRHVRRKPAVVHVCDHSNAMYSRQIDSAPVVVTCHDLLAVRGALGEQTDCPASPTGKILQRWILSGLRRAAAVGCSSRATLADAERLIGRSAGAPILKLVELGLAFPYRPLPQEVARARVAELMPRLNNAPYVLHVGSNLRRKNREGALRIFAKTEAQWNGNIVFAGDPLSTELRSLAEDLGISARAVDVPRPSNEQLEALYNCATALLYPSRFEGFGWPIAEAQACGCPVICSNAPPMSDVAGDAGLLRNADDEEGFAADLLRLRDSRERELWSRRSLENAKRFSAARMVDNYRELYRSVSAAC